MQWEAGPGAVVRVTLGQLDGPGAVGWSWCSGVLALGQWDAGPGAVG